VIEIQAKKNVMVAGFDNISIASVVRVKDSFHRQDARSRKAETGLSVRKPLFRALLSQLHPGREGNLAEMQGLERPPEGTRVTPAKDPDGKGVQVLWPVTTLTNGG
jgi:hypothetical protein